MKKIAIETTSIITPKVIKSNAWVKNGFSHALDEAILAGDRKNMAVENQKMRAGFSYTDEKVNQLITNPNQVDIVAAANSSMAMEEKKRKISLFMM